MRSFMVATRCASSDSVADPSTSARKLGFSTFLGTSGVRMCFFPSALFRTSLISLWCLLCSYVEPFDRHDWIVDRCGKEVRYVIDYYKGKEDPFGNTFGAVYIDARPAVSWGGLVDRARKFVSDTWGI